MTIAEPALMTPREAAEALRVSRSKVYTLITTGRLPSTRITGSIRVPRAALEQFISASTTWPQAPIAFGDKRTAPVAHTRTAPEVDRDAVDHTAAPRS